jgi:hypothetical protein
MTVATRTPVEMHSDHRHWKGDVDCWNDDISNWRSESQVALDHLRQIIQAIQERTRSIDDHADSIAKLESELEFHEKNLAAALQSNATTELDDDLRQRHVEEADLHRRQRVKHEVMKKSHHRAMVQVEMLRTVVGVPMT